MGWDYNCGNVRYTDFVIMKCHLINEINLAIVAASEQSVVMTITDKLRLIGKDVPNPQAAVLIGIV